MPVDVGLTVPALGSLIVPKGVRGPWESFAAAAPMSSFLADVERLVRRRTGVSGTSSELWPRDRRRPIESRRRSTLSRLTLASEKRPLTRLERGVRFGVTDGCGKAEASGRSGRLLSWSFSPSSGTGFGSIEARRAFLKDSSALMPARLLDNAEGSRERSTRSCARGVTRLPLRKRGAGEADVRLAAAAAPATPDSSAAGAMLNLRAVDPAPAPRALTATPWLVLRE